MAATVADRLQLARERADALRGRIAAAARAGDVTAAAFLRAEARLAGDPRYGGRAAGRGPRADTVGRFSR